jgi:hypothetical protein
MGWARMMRAASRAAAQAGTGPILVLLALDFWPLAGTRSQRPGEPCPGEAPAVSAGQAQAAAAGKPGG